MHGRHAGGGRAWLPPALLVIATVVTGGIVMAGLGFAEPPEAPRAGTSSTTVSIPISSTPQRLRSRPAAAQRDRQSPVALPDAGRPRRVVVESLGIDASVVPVATNGSTLVPPDDPGLLGWWSGGARAGAARGTALVTGHTVHTGGGAMDDLEQTSPGAEILVSTDRGAIAYVAKSVKVLDKQALARQAPQLFSQRSKGRLVLVTCEDWDGTGYRSNVVVTAVPAR